MVVQKLQLIVCRQVGVAPQQLQLHVQALGLAQLRLHVVKRAWVLILALACFFRLFSLVGRLVQGWALLNQAGLHPQPWPTCSCFHLMCSWRVSCGAPWLSVFSAQSTLLHRSTCGNACKPENIAINAALAPSQHDGQAHSYIASGPSAGPDSLSTLDLALVQGQMQFPNALALLQNQMHLRALLQGLLHIPNASMNEPDAKKNKATNQTETTNTYFC